MISLLRKQQTNRNEWHVGRRTDFIYVRLISWPATNAACNEADKFYVFFVTVHLH